jgi:predicted acyltransferase
MSANNATPPTRVLSVDAFRGFVMLLMMAEVLQLWSVSQYFPYDDFAGEFWATIKFHTTHVEWGGCSLHDLIQPSFTFLVGVSLPFSIAQREERGQGFWKMLLHAAGRSLLLILIAFFLRSIGRSSTNFMFTDTLGQIGLGYTILFVIAYFAQKAKGAMSWALPWGSLALLLIGYWALFAFYPLPADDFDYKTVGVSDAWRRQHSYDGFMAHWNKNTNPAMDFDRWWLNQFPRERRISPQAQVASTVGLLASPMGPLVATTSVHPGSTEKTFAYESGGYATLSFIPTLGTMILGLIAGFWLRRDWSNWTKLGAFLAAGVAGILLGMGLEVAGICPSVKRIWTPAWTIYSGGWTFLILAGFYFVIEVIGFWQWSFPLLVLGANSIVAYCSNAIFRSFISATWRTHLGADTFRYFDTPEVRWEQPLIGLAVLVTLWLMLFWMYRNKIFVRI